MQGPRARALAVDAVLAWLLAAAPALAADDALDEARQLLLTGRYAEAAEQYAALGKKQHEPVAVVLGLARCQAAQGQYDRAAAGLEAAAKKHPKAAALPAELAQLALDRGDHAAARKWAEQAIELEKDQLTARWVQAEVARLAGDLEAAGKGYAWFVDYYNATDQFDDPDALRQIGRAAAQFARWNRLSDQFSFLVNELYPAALKLDPNYWPAHAEAGALFLEKYNRAEATRSLQAALAINPNAPQIHAALAELAILDFDLDGAQRSIRQALLVNPRYLPAWWMQADLHLANFEPDVAVEVLEKARKLNPRSEETLGRLAASYGMVDGLDDLGPQTRLGKLEAEVRGRNRHCGTFYTALADALDKGRRFPTAAHFYAKAVAALPQMVGPRGQLALMYLRLGEEAKARPILEEAFQIDPFNVRVSNSIKVLEVLDGYETIETEHFILRFDPQHDRLLARYAARELEALYPEVCTRLGYEPAGKSLFEIFSDAKNTKGHGWFSARMVGLPQIHTIGACAGKMVALTSPSSMESQFNWARVLKHEFVHVVNLQQTNFNVPHWYTEALAVLLEDSPRPANWNEMLARRVPKGEVFDLDSINRGFIRPSSSEDWQMAYCQAEIYAEYLIDTYGEDAPGKLLAGYRDNLSTRAALKREFGVEQEDLEKGYRAYLAEIAEKLQAGNPPEAEQKLSELVKAHAENPDDVEAAADLALAYVQRKSYAEAGKLADRVLAAEPRHPLASYVKAKLLLVIGERQAALEKLEAALDRQQPQLELVKLLAGLKYQAKDFSQAAKLYELGRKHAPYDPAWSKSLAVVYLKTGDTKKLVPLLTKLAEADADDLAMRKKLAQLALAADDHAAAARWASECLEIDVQDALSHQMLARALVGQKRFAEAIEEYKVAIQLQPEQHALHLGLAAAYQQAGQIEEARRTLAALLKSKPDLPAATQMLEKLKP